MIDERYIARMHIPSGCDVMTNIHELGYSSRVALVDPGSVIDLDDGAAVPQRIMHARLVVVDMWDSSTRRDQEACLRRISDLIDPTTHIMLRYSNIDSFKHDGYVHSMFGLKE